MSLGGDIMEEHYEKNVIPRLKEQIDNVQNGCRVVFKALREQPDYYYAWQANIAMQFVDEYWRNFELKGDTKYKQVEDIHKIANQAAKNFLDLLIKPIENEESSSN